MNREVNLIEFSLFRALGYRTEDGTFNPSLENYVGMTKSESGLICNRNKAEIDLKEQLKLTVNKCPERVQATPYLSCSQAPEFIEHGGCNQVFDG